MFTADDFISYYSLQRHTEGGFYKETYRAAEGIASSCLPGRYAGARSFCTAIYFLLEKGNFSSFHRIKSDECWHFYAGGAMFVHVIENDGRLKTVCMGADILQSARFQFVVPAGCWFASETAPGSAFSFAGCTVAPGFDFADFEIASREVLTGQYPQHEALIKRLTR